MAMGNLNMIGLGSLGSSDDLTDIEIMKNRKIEIENE